MNTLYITNTGKVMLDANGEVMSYDTDIESIRNISMLTEDTKVIYKCGNIDEKIEAKAGDIVITFYRDEFVHPVIVVKSDTWRENLEDFRAKEQKRKEEWAARQAENDASPCAGTDCTKGYC